MALVRPPNHPAKGVCSRKSVACCQSTLPVRMGMRPERKASTAESVAIGTAKRTTQRMPHRLIARKKSTIALAISFAGTMGRNQALIAFAERYAVRPQVGTQPHQ